jgi:hypothetical protein
LHIVGVFIINMRPNEGENTIIQSSLDNFLNGGHVKATYIEIVDCKKCRKNKPTHGNFNQSFLSNIRTKVTFA